MAPNSPNSIALACRRCAGADPPAEPACIVLIVTFAAEGGVLAIRPLLRRDSISSVAVVAVASGLQAAIYTGTEE